VDRQTRSQPALHICCAGFSVVSDRAGDAAVRTMTPESDQRRMRMAAACSPVQVAAAVPVVLGDVRGHIQLPYCAHEVLTVMRLVGAHSDAAGAALLLLGEHQTKRANAQASTRSLLLLLLLISFRRTRFATITW